MTEQEQGTLFQLLNEIVKCSDNMNTLNKINDLADFIGNLKLKPELNLGFNGSSSFIPPILPMIPYGNSLWINSPQFQVLKDQYFRCWNISCAGKLVNQVEIVGTVEVAYQHILLNRYPNEMIDETKKQLLKKIKAEVCDKYL